MNSATSAALASVSSAVSASPERRDFAVPLADLVEFSGLAEARRTEIHYTLRILARLHEQIPTAGKCAACNALAAAHAHAMRGLSGVSLYRKYQAYIATGWRGLIKNYKAPHYQPDAFVQEVRRVAELNARSMGEAYQQLRERWAAGDTVPGYGTWMDAYRAKFPELPVPKVWPRGFFPAGWSVDNLRRYGPSKGSRALSLRGLAAAKKHFPTLRRDPSQLRPLELITIDDFELDALCVFSGDQARGLKPQIGRIAGLLAIDVSTRKKLVWGIGQRLEREEPQADGTIRTVRTGIARIDVQMLLHSLFEKYGLPDYPITLLVENASAAIAPELQLCLETLFDGRIKVERTGLIDHKTLANGFAERGGKPWEKGWIESTFNQLWNMLGAMKGYKGSNQRLNAPASLDEAIRYTKALIGQGERGSLNLPPEAIAQLRLPFMNTAEAEQAFAWAISVNEQRDNHAYIGFARVTEYRLTEGDAPVPFAHLALLAPEAQLAAVPVERMETVAERWQAKLAEVQLTPIPALVLALLLLTPKRVAYRNHSVTFVHDRMGYTYVDPTGAVLGEHITEGTELLAYLDTNHPEALQLADLSGRYLGSVVRHGGRSGAVDIRDKAALSAAAEAQSKIFNRAVATVRTRHAAADAQMLADREHNDQIKTAHREATAGLSNAEKIGLAAGAAAAVQAASKADAATVQRATARAAAKLTEADREAFLAAPAAEIEQLAAPTDEGESLADYL